MDAFVLSVNTNDNIRDLKKLEGIFDFSNLDKNHDFFSNKNKKVIGEFKIETPKNIWIVEIVCLRSKAYSFKCKDNIESENKLKGLSKSQSKNIKFEEFKKILNGEEYQEECDNYNLRSLNHEMYLQKKKSFFDDKHY